MAESDLNHPGRARAALAVRFRDCLRRFPRTTRAGATAIVALGVSVITVGASAVIVDHNWLYDQRDALKFVSDAAAVASTIELERHRGTMTQDQMNSLLRETARTYAMLNLHFLSGDRLTRAKDTLAVEITPYQNENKVDVSISADLGGTLFSRHLPITGNYTGPTTVAAGSGVELQLTPVEVVLAIDASGSMRYTLQETIVYRPWEQSRMDIVKAAARSLVDVLRPSAANRVAVSVLPWQASVRLTSRTKTQWENRGWAEFPKSRHYPVTYNCRPRDTCTYTSEDQTMPEHPPERWRACMDETRVSMDGHASHADVSEWFTPPSRLPFAQAIFPGLLGAAYSCAPRPHPGDYDRQNCYSNSFPAQRTCDHDIPSFIPLTTDRVQIDDAIDGLEAVGDFTYSALGLLWGQRLLSHSWQAVWGDPVHPVDNTLQANKDTRKVIVLLTDGEDSICSSRDPNCERSDVGIGRSRACDAVKAQGTEIFVIAAIDNPSSALADALRACSSEAEHPEGTYAFLDHTDEASLRATFTEIANQLTIVRRTH